MTRHTPAGGTGAVAHTSDRRQRWSTSAWPRDFLEKEGHVVVVADNGAKALKALQENAFDLILMDVQMPVMDGVEATAAIRQAEETTGHHIPIIAMTAHAMAGDRQRFLKAGMDGYVSKPIHSQELLEAIDSVLSAPSA